MIAAATELSREADEANSGGDGCSKGTLGVIATLDKGLAEAKNLLAN